jgi:serine/threonine-protein kinase
MPSSDPSADRNLIFGLLALQMDFVSREQLLDAMHAWMLDKQTALGEILCRRGVLGEDERQVLDLALEKHIKRHAGDPQASLVAVRVDPAVRASLVALDDADILASLASSRQLVTEAVLAAARPVAHENGPGSTIRYSKLRPHAQGGLGEVSVALDVELHREVALKEIQERFADQPDARGRFLREAVITGNLEHPGVVSVYGLGVYPDGRPYYAMRFIKGDSLHEAIRRFHQADAGRRDAGERALSLRDLLGRFVAVCNVVAYAHSRGVIHRDLKPANVMLGEFGETLVVDWGLARVLDQHEGDATAAARPLPLSVDTSSAATVAGQVIGTPAFMAPEQARGEHDRVGLASDVFALGATLYCLLTGQAPYAGRDILAQAVRADVAPARQHKQSVPAALEAVCRKAMAVGPEQRYRTAQALAEDMQRFLADEPVSAYREPWTTRARRWLRRRRTVVSAIIAALVVAAVGSGVATVFLSRAYERESRAKVLAQENEQQAQQQRDRARRNFSRAREAVDRWLTRVSEELTDTPQAERLRHTLLEDALAFHERFMKEEDASPAARLQAARAAAAVGVINWRLSRPGRAEDAYRTAIALLTVLTDEFPEELEYRLELVHAYNYLGTLHYGQGGFDRADQAWKTAVALHEKVPVDYPDTPSHRHTRAGLTNNQANLLQERGHFKEAEATYRRAIALNSALARAARDRTSYLFDLTIQYDNLAKVLHKLDRDSEAVAAAREALGLAQGLVKQYPTHTPYRVAQADGHFRLGSLALDGQRSEEARKEFRAALALYQALVDDFPFTAGHVSQMGNTLNNLGLLARQQGQLGDARAALEEAIARQQRAMKLSPSSKGFPSQLHRHYVNLLSVLLEQKDGGAAPRAAAALAGSLPDDPQSQALAAETLVRCMGLAPAGEARALADQAINLLRQAVKVGFADWETLVTRPLWGPLRGRPDFDQLVADLGESVRKKALAEARRRARARPDDLDVQDSVAERLSDLALWYRFLRRHYDGVAAYEEALAIREKAVLARPERTDLALRLGGTWTNLAHLQGDGKKPEQAFRSYAQALKLLEPLVKEKTTVQTARLFLRNLYLGRGKLYAVGGKYADAVADLDRAVAYCLRGEEGPLLWVRVDALARLGDHARAAAEADDLGRAPSLPGARLYDLACIHALNAASAARDISRPLAEREKCAEQYARAAVALLKRASSAGFFRHPANVAHMDSDLVSLSDRDDYQQVRAGLKPAKR